MARRPRIGLPGYHHIVNRGVNRTDIFSDETDKEKFLQILCKACKVYGIVVHDYCLMDNHYHLLIENTEENLSLFMRQLNGNYAIYFNKKTKRIGHLWQGRYASWYIHNEAYLYRTIRYIEYNPVNAGISSRIKDYPYTLGSCLLNGIDIPVCAKASLLATRFTLEQLSLFLGEPMQEEEMRKLRSDRREVVTLDEKSGRIRKARPLESYFTDEMDKVSRNEAIYKAYRDGYTQSSIAKHVGLSAAMVSMIVKRFNI